MHMAQYKSNSTKIICYIEYVFYQINQTKRLFKKSQQTNIINRSGKIKPFNFPKYYIMSHYSNWIKLYGSGTGFTTGIKKAIYIIWIKNFIKWINMKKNYKKQILKHNVDKFSLMIRANLNIFFSTKILIQANQIAEL